MTTKDSQPNTGNPGRGGCLHSTEDRVREKKGSEVQALCLDPKHSHRDEEWEGERREGEQ